MSPARPGRVPADVPTFLATCGHPRLAEIERVREAVLGAAPGLGERIKWNAPSFGYGDEDRITLRLQPGDRLEVIFHRGAKARPDPSFRFDDPHGLLTFAAPDRAWVALRDADDTEARLPALVEVARAWLAATR